MAWLRDPAGEGLSADLVVLVSPPVRSGRPWRRFWRGAVWVLDGDHVLEYRCHHPHDSKAGALFCADRARLEVRLVGRNVRPRSYSPRNLRSTG